ncbi:MAG: methyltransferase domain-containing protein [Aulosira sp. DedQUE10]|nr:methyltransferase domain-containing protein [Aulosira sp. DedQUE10]
MIENQTVNLPYFDQLFGEIAQGHTEVIKAFGLHIHWGYWQNPALADGSIDDFASAAENLTTRVCDAGGAADGQSILDCDCGFGGTIASLSDRFHHLQLTGVNIDPRQLARAREQVQPRNHNHIEFVEGDACQLNFADNSFNMKYENIPTESLLDILLYRWQQTLQPFNVSQIAGNKVFNDLIAAYSTPGRYYHTLKHILHVLITIDNLQTYVKDLSTVQLAAWFHDIIYDTQAKNNEERSAEYTCKLLSILGLTANNIAHITRLIINTKYHQAAADDFDSQVLLDADLAILATDSIQYQEYVNAIRQEYAWVPQADYIAGRKQILERFLQRQRIYFTPLMLEAAEQSARANLIAEIKILDKG